jgi:hypothetical protein
MAKPTKAKVGCPKSQGKPRCRRAESQGKPTRHPFESQGKPRKANESQEKPRFPEISQRSGTVNPQACVIRSSLKAGLSRLTALYERRGNMRR